MQNLCKGCTSFRAYRDIGDQCGDESIPQISNKEQCPCSICIVKTMCTNGCKDFQDYKILCKKEIGDDSIEGY
jgi:hypothetical protein